MIYIKSRFLSTLSLRRATYLEESEPEPQSISIHALLAESDVPHRIRLEMACRISIHALLAESDSFFKRLFGIHEEFLSTLSLRRATMQIVIVVVHALISIHALLAESDRETGNLLFFGRHFYPRSPCGERPLSGSSRATVLVFLSTLSLRRATSDSSLVRLKEMDFYPRSPCGERLNDAINGCNADFISIHALLAESDGYQRPYGRPTTNFYPRSPCGERPETVKTSNADTKISIHALLAESDMQIVIVVVDALISIHALLAESDQYFFRNL